MSQSRLVQSVMFTLYNAYIFKHLAINSTTAAAVEADMEFTITASPATTMVEYVSAHGT